MSHPGHREHGTRVRSWEPTLSVAHRRRRPPRAKTRGQRIAATLGWMALLLVLVVTIVLLVAELTSEAPRISQEEYRQLLEPLTKQ